MHTKLTKLIYFSYFFSTNNVVCNIFKVYYLQLLQTYVIVIIACKTDSNNFRKSSILSVEAPLSCVNSKFLFNCCLKIDSIAYWSVDIWLSLYVSLSARILFTYENYYVLLCITPLKWSQKYNVFIQYGGILLESFKKNQNTMVIWEIRNIQK